MSLADAFSEDVRRAAVNERLRKGLIIRIRSDLVATQISPVKEKYFVLAGLSREGVAYLFVINSGIADCIAGRPALASQQLRIEKKDHDFLTKPHSFIDCSKCFERPLGDLENCLISDFSCVKGFLSPLALKRINGIVSTSKTLNPRQKQSILSPRK